MKSTSRGPVIFFGGVVAALVILAVVAQVGAIGTRAVEVQITYPGKWSGFYINQHSLVNLNGSGNTELVLNRPSNATVWNIIVRIYEVGPPGITLTVRIATTNGQLLNEDFTSGVGTSALATYTVTPVFCLGDYYKCLSES